MRSQPELFAAVGVTAVLLLPIAWLVFVPSPSFGAWARWGISGMPHAVGSTLEAVFRATFTYHENTCQLLRAFLISLLLQTNVVTFYYLIGRAMGFTIPYSAYFLIVPVAIVVMMLPLSINGIGIREGVFVLLLSTFGATSAESVAFAWTEHGLTLCYGIVGGIVFLLRKSRAIPQPLANDDRDAEHLKRGSAIEVRESS